MKLQFVETKAVTPLMVSDRLVVELGHPIGMQLKDSQLKVFCDLTELILINNNNV